MSPYHIIVTIVGCIMSCAAVIYLVSLSGITILSAIAVVYAASILCMFVLQRSARRNSDCLDVVAPSRYRRHDEVPTSGPLSMSASAVVGNRS